MNVTHAILIIDGKALSIGRKMSSGYVTISVDEKHWGGPFHVNDDTSMGLAETIVRNITGKRDVEAAVWLARVLEEVAS